MIIVIYFENFNKENANLKSFDNPAHLCDNKNDKSDKQILICELANLNIVLE